MILLKQVSWIILLSRPIFYPLILSIYLLGLITNLPPDTSSILIDIVFLTLPLGIIICGLNDIADHKSDLDNPRKNSWQGIKLQKHQFPLVITLVLSNTLLFSLIYLIIRKPLHSFLVILIAFCAYLYSFPPFRFKSKPFLDSAINALGLVAIFLFGNLHTANTFKLSPGLMAITLGMIAMHTLSSLMDLQIDKKNKDLTTSVFLGQKLTLFYCSLIFFLILFVLPSSTVVLIYICFSILFMITSIFINNIPSSKIFWIQAIGFIFLCTYLLIFNQTYLLKIFTPN